MKTSQRIHSRGKITIPVAIREELDVEDGDVVEVDVKRPALGDSGEITRAKNHD
jgi:AbrB family looped-hinge helix DNA binding protein